MSGLLHYPMVNLEYSYLPQGNTIVHKLDASGEKRTMSGDGNEPNTGNKCPKQQGGSPLPFFDHDFKAYHTTEWYQWELNVQILAKGATQLNAGNDVGTKMKALLF
eukprot:8525680-Ditylum_brightwellii.AAC.1